MKCTLVTVTWLMGLAACDGDASPVDGDATQVERDASQVDGEPKACTSEFADGDSGCSAKDVCLRGYGCYPKAGSADSECGSERTSVAAIEGPIEPWSSFLVEGEYTGEISTSSPGYFALTNDAETVEIRYSIGNHALPIAVGDDVVVHLRSIRSFGSTIGMALRTPDGRLLALIDSGTWGSAWQPRGATNEDLTSGFSVGSELMGCAVMANENDCAAYVPVGLRFTHGTNTVLVPPGQSRDLVTDVGTYRVVNVGAYQLADVHCTDMAPLASWAILAVDGGSR